MPAEAAVQRIVARGAAALVLVVWFAGCATRPLPPVDASLRALAASVQTDLADVERGRALLVSACATCHEPVHPLDCTLAVWDEVMPRMLAKSELPAADGRCVRAYVLVVQAAASR